MRAQRRSAREKLGEILVCADRIRDLGLSKLNVNFSYDEHVEIIEKANVFLKKHPEILPKLTQYGDAITSGPSETLKYLVRKYEPKDRRKPHLTAVHSGRT